MFILKSFFSYLCGIFFAFIFWYTFISDLNVSATWNFIIFATTLTTLGVAYTVSVAIRCITYLMCLEFFGRAGHHITRAVVLSLILTGPMRNILHNASDVVRSFTCSTSLTYNLSKTKFDLLTKPFEHALISMEKNISEIPTSFRAIDVVMKPIVEEIEGEDLEVESVVGRRQSMANGSDADFYQKSYTKKLQRRCTMQIEKGAEKCKKSFTDAYDECYDTMPVMVNAIVCWPMKVDFVCNIGDALGAVDKLCDASTVVDSDFGETYADLKNTEKMLKGNFSDVDMELKFVGKNEIPALISTNHTRQLILSEFNEKRTILERTFTIISWILSFIYFKVIFLAFSYHKRYLAKIDFDNNFIDKYFHKIDKRRRNRGARCILPLRKVERRQFIDVKSPYRNLNELRGSCMKILRAVMEIVTVTCFVLLDRLVFESLDLIARHARIDYTQEGVHRVTITVKGEGIIATMIKSAIMGLSTNETVATVASNLECLPAPRKLSNWVLIQIYGTILVGVLLLYFEIFLRRLRPVCCSHFYPKRQKKRILFLFNKLLKRRKKFMVFMCEAVKEKSRQSYANIFLKLRFRYKKYFDWLKVFPCARRKCIICDEYEPVKRDYSRPLHFMSCVTPNCKATHCEDCWFDVNEICLCM